MLEAKNRLLRRAGRFAARLSDSSRSLSAVLRRLGSPRAHQSHDGPELAPFVKLSATGKLSVSLADVVKTRRYREDLVSLRRIAAMHH